MGVQGGAGSLRALSRLDFGPAAISRQRQIGEGPIRTLDGAGIAMRGQMFAFQSAIAAPASGTWRRSGGTRSTCFGSFSTGVTDVHFVDYGYHVLACDPTSLKDENAATSGDRQDARIAALELVSRSVGSGLLRPTLKKPRPCAGPDRTHAERRVTGPAGRAAA